MTVNIRNVNVRRHGAGTMDCSVSWEIAAGPAKGRYHVWLDMPDRKPRQVVYKNPLGNPKPSEPGYFPTRRLQLRSVVNLHMVGEALRIAREADLYAKADRDLAEAEDKRIEAVRVAQEAEDHADLIRILRKIAPTRLTARLLLEELEASKPDA